MLARTLGDTGNNLVGTNQVNASRRGKLTVSQIDGVADGSTARLRTMPNRERRK